MFLTRSSTLMATLAVAVGAGLAGCGEDAAESSEGRMTEGAFAAVADAPDGAEQAGGTASMERRDDGTKVAVSLTGLAPDTKYVAHVHKQRCDLDSGGKHYQFEPGGPELPPNEIHLSLTADGDGKAAATTEADSQAGPDAVSVVVHYQDKKMLCADLASPRS